MTTKPPKSAPRPDRKTVALHLRHGIDNDLIKWFETIPEGSRQDVMKTALRNYMGIYPANGEQQMLSTLGAWLEQLQRHVDNQFDSTRTAIASAQIAGAPGQVETVEAAPRLSAEEIARRDERMKKARQW